MTKMSCSSFVAISFAVIVTLSSCSLAPPSAYSSSPEAAVPSSSAVATFDEYAESVNALPGKFDTIYNYSTSTGEINGFTVKSISVLDTYTAGNTVLNNVVVLDLFGDTQSVKDFARNKAFCYCVYDDGTKNIDFGSAVYYDADNDSLYLLFDSSCSVSDAQYFVLGGFNAGKNEGYSNVAFVIS